MTAAQLPTKITIIGGGNLGQAIAKGLVYSGRYTPQDITITRRHLAALDGFKEQGYRISGDNCQAVAEAEMIILAIRPLQFKDLAAQLKDCMPAKAPIVSTISGVSLEEMKVHLGNGAPVVRIMPNIAVAISESMTCISGHADDPHALAMTTDVCNILGSTVVIDEDQMTPATALCGCGVAFFLRSIRAASQGGIEIGFHADEALVMAAQTAKGAAALLLDAKSHPEAEIDKVTTPRGCTIAGLNQMEYEGFSSALIKGVVTSAEMASKLY